MLCWRGFELFSRWVPLLTCGERSSLHCGRKYLNFIWSWPCLILFYLTCAQKSLLTASNFDLYNRTEWSPVESNSVCNHTSDNEVITGRPRSGSPICLSRVRFVYHEYDYRPGIGRHEVLLQLIIKITIS